MSDETLALGIDTVSLLVSVPGKKTLDALETELAARGFTLGFAVPDAAVTVADWLALGAPGAPSLFADPADHLVAGLEATLAGGRRLEVRPGPRRAVGPDLTALLLGSGGRLGVVDHAWLRIHRLEARRPALPLPEGVDLDPPPSEGELRLFASLEEGLRSR